MYKICFYDGLSSKNVFVNECSIQVFPRTLILFNLVDIVEKHFFTSLLSNIDTTCCIHFETKNIHKNIVYDKTYF